MHGSDLGSNLSILCNLEAKAKQFQIFLNDLNQVWSDEQSYMVF